MSAPWVVLAMWGAGAAIVGFVVSVLAEDVGRGGSAGPYLWWLRYLGTTVAEATDDQESSAKVLTTVSVLLWPVVAFLAVGAGLAFALWSVPAVLRATWQLLGTTIRTVRGRRVKIPKMKVVKK